MASTSISSRVETRCCIVGGGPAGIVTGYLLARAGVDVVVLEKHADFFRDFRGDTIHPSTLRLVGELGLLDEFLKIEHSQLRKLSARFADEDVPLADFSHVPGPCKFIALMPQWDFLSFFATRAERFPTFRLLMETEAVELLRTGKTVTGVRAKSKSGEIEIRADLVIAADGRSSVIRSRALLKVVDTGAPIDVLWMRLSKREGDPVAAFGNIGAGGLLVTIDRTTYFQCALIIPKGGYATVRAAGLDAFHSRIVGLAPFLANRVQELTSWDEVKLLTVTIDHLRRWHLPGLLCIGDAAHAMSPVGGVGINLAIQDAVATVNILAKPLRRGRPPEVRLAAVQRRRMFPARIVQAGQTAVQARLLRPLLATTKAVRAPFVLRLFAKVPVLQRVPAYVIGVGFRPERIRIAQTVQPRPS